MKKLMIVAAVICATCLAQASSVDWAINYAGKGTTWVNNDVCVYAFNGADYDAIIALVTTTGSDKLQSDLQGYALNSDVKFTTNFKGAAKTATTRSDDLTGSKMFWMVFADGSFDSGKSVLWTAATDVSANIYEPPSTGTLLSLTGTNFANTGTIANVPEPTSGLLLLLGVAGMALRRRRA